jgi:hypothetical protein
MVRHNRQYGLRIRHGKTHAVSRELLRRLRFHVIPNAVRNPLESRSFASLRMTTFLFRRFVSMLEIVVCGMPHSAESCVWVSPCSSRRMRTDSPGVTSTRFLAGMELRMPAFPVVMGV